jgi:hypothetical protein
MLNHSARTAKFRDEACLFSQLAPRGYLNFLIILNATGYDMPIPAVRYCSSKQQHICLRAAANHKDGNLRWCTHCVQLTAPLKAL